MEFLLLEKIALSIALGALIGIEREYHKGKIGIGIRTMAFLCLFGMLSTYFSMVYSFVWIMIIALVFTAAFAVSIFWYRVQRQRYVGLTTSITALLTFFIGAMVAVNMFKEALATSAVIFVMLFMKGKIVKQVRHLTESEIVSAVEFAILAFVIYPFLPETEFINIKQVWEVVIIISIVSFIGFIAMRRLGETRGALVTSVCGSLISSNAAAVALVHKYRQNRKMFNFFLIALLLTLFVMILRNIFLGFLITQNAEVIIRSIKYVVVGIIYFGALFYILSKKIPRAHKRKRHMLEVESPFAIKPALYFGAVFLVILLVSKLSISCFGISSLLPLSFIGGFVSSSAAAASASMLFINGSIGLGMLITAIIAASMGSLFDIVLVAFLLREHDLAKQMFKYVSMLAALLLIMILF